MADAPIAFIIHVVSGQNMNAGRQGPNAQPIARMQDEGAARVRAHHIAAGVTTLAQLTGSGVRGYFGARAG